MHVTLLCKVVDNYGDIGFVYRLSRSLSEKYPHLKLSLVVSNLQSFSAMAPGIKEIPYQIFNGWSVLDWNADVECKKFFIENPPQLILECFQCGRPEWLDEILFDKQRTSPVQIVNVEYLTAEDWADDFHLLKSGTRSALVKKINFMPGFTDKTGGLVLDKDFMENLSSRSLAIKKLHGFIAAKKSGGQADAFVSHFDGTFFNATVFAYDKNLEPLVLALKRFQDRRQERDRDFRLNIFAASGLSFNSLKESWEKHGRPFNLTELPYLDQQSWDSLLTLCDFNFIRGEDSFSRACLCGAPFLWNAYVQDEEYQLVKVRAVVDKLKNHFDQAGLGREYQNYLNAMMIYNKTEQAAPCAEAQDALEGYGKDITEEEAIFNALLDSDRTKKVFQSFSASLIANGNLTEKLEMFIKDIPKNCNL